MSRKAHFIEPVEEIYALFISHDLIHIPIEERFGNRALEIQDKLKLVGCFVKGFFLNHVGVYEPMVYARQDQIRGLIDGIAPANLSPLYLGLVRVGEKIPSSMFHDIKEPFRKLEKAWEQLDIDNSNKGSFGPKALPPLVCGDFHLGVAEQWSSWKALPFDSICRDLPHQARYK